MVSVDGFYYVQICTDKSEVTHYRMTMLFLITNLLMTTQYIPVPCYSGYILPQFKCYR